MANLPEKNITLVDKITSIPSNSNLFLNADGEFRQASVNDVIKSATVVSDTVNNAINDAMQDSIDSHFKQATGSPILLTDTADGTLIDFKGKGRSTQDGEPTPDSPIAIKSVADGGYFDGELLQGYYNTDGTVNGTAQYVSTKNLMPCNGGDVIKFTYAETVTKLVILFFDDTKYLSQVGADNSAQVNATAPSGATRFGITIHSLNGITPQTAKPITVTINGKYALIVKSKGKNKLDVTHYLKISGVEKVTLEDNKITIGSGTSGYGIRFSNDDVGLKAGKTYAFSVKTLAGTMNGGYRLHYTDNTYSKTFGANEIFTAEKEVSYILLYVGMPYSGDTDIVISDLQIEENTVITEYEPYKETVTYIPLDEPLRSNLDGTVTDEVGLDKVTRRFAEVVFDGTEDWHFADNSNINYTYTSSISNAKPNSLVVCNAMCSTDLRLEENNCYINANKFPIFCSDSITSLDEWKAKLQANPITVIYELAEPIVETIEPIDIVTYDNVTYLTASDNAEMELEYPTSKVAGIASIGYSKGRKAEYEVELLKAQLLELQTAMVNSL